MTLTESNNNNSIPLVSICCVTYNHENYIKQCLDGFVMQQTNFSFEILVHEDASTDNTAAIVKEYETKYPHLFKCVYQVENQFLKQNTLTNILFPMSKGKYISLCEGDDYWTDPYKLQKQVDFLELNKLIVGCFHDVSTVDKNGKIIKDNYHESHKTTYNQVDSLAHGGSYATCSLVFRSLAIKNIPYWFIKACSDYAVDLLITEFGDIAYISENMGAYRIHEGGVWQGNKTHLNMETVILRYKACLENPKFKKNYGDFFYKKISDVSLSLTKHYKAEQNFSKSLKYAITCFYYTQPKNSKFFTNVFVPIVNMKFKSIFKKMRFPIFKIKQLIKRSINAIGYDIHTIRKPEIKKPEIKLEDVTERKKTYYYREGLRFDCIKKYDFKTILDIGANEGLFAGKIITVFPNAKVHCFEPLKEAFEQLKSEFPEHQNITFHNFGLGDENKTVEIFKNEYSPSSSFLKMLDIHKTNFDFAVKVEQEAVSIKRLDEVFTDDINKPLLLKIDVQGYEKFVLDGAINVISKTDVIIIETSFVPLYEDQSLFNDIYHYLEDLGFSYSGSIEQLTAPESGEILQQDALFIRKK